MEVHRPHPIQSPREFLKEVGIIVLGVLLALGGEQLVERAHWAYEVRDAHTALRLEVAWADSVFAFRVAADSCVAQKLTVFDSITERAARHAPVPHVGIISFGIGNALIDNTWAAYRSAQVLSHFDNQDLDAYSAFHFQVANAQRLVDREGDAWDGIRVLQGDPSRLAQEDIAGTRRALESARSSNTLIALIAREELDRSTRLGIPAPGADPVRVRRACATPSSCSIT